MSLNDPRWGRNTGDDEKKPEDKSAPKANEPAAEEPEYREPELREPRREDPPRQQQQPKREEMDIEELWNQFNDRLNAMLGNKGAQNGGRDERNQRNDNSWQSQNNRRDEDEDFQEPPPRADQGFDRPSENGSKSGRFGNFGGSFGGNGNNGSNGNGGKPPFDIEGAANKASGSMIAAAAIIAIGAWLASGFYIVPEGQRGVVTTFGKYSESTNAGFRWHMPYPIQDVDLVDVSSVRKAEIGMRGTSQRLREALMLTDDENIVDVMFNVQYRIKDGPGAEEFLFRTRDPLGAVIQTAESAMREVVGRKKMDSVLFESKLEIAQEVQKLMQEMLDRYHSGIQVLSVAIQNAQPPQQVQAAFNDAVKAGQDRERQINEGEAYANDVVPKARGMAERLRQEAEGYKAGVISQAEGDASRFNQVYNQYKAAPKVTRDRMYVDTMQKIFENTGKVMVDTKSSNNLLYLPMDKLIEKSRAGDIGAASQSAAAVSAAQAESADSVVRTNSRSLSRDVR